ILVKAYTDSHTFVRDFPFKTKKQGLLFVGGPGSGKTHLAAAVLRELTKRGFQAVFFLYQQLLEKIRSGYDPNSGSSAREAYQAALDAEVLLLDDLGAHRATDWVEDTITSIITHRCNHRMPVIATTNFRDESVDSSMPSSAAAQVAGGQYLSERIGMRARSRLCEMCQVITTRGVPDYRERR
ncbi:MAG: ATP-binding protein, partial [bacterium]|nr:ATP-binding protein [bacterium]